MNNVQTIRKRLGLSQAALAAAVGVTQGNISHIEQGRQEVTPSVARRIIAVAADRGVPLGFDDIYAPEGGVTLPVEPEPPSPRSKPRPLSASGQGANSARVSGESSMIADPAVSAGCACRGDERKTATAERGEAA